MTPPSAPDSSTPTYPAIRPADDPLARDRRIMAVLGPTNTGKTHLAMERMMGHRTGMIGFPLRLLARENYDRVVKAKGLRNVALITGEEKIVPPEPRWFVCAVESVGRCGLPVPGQSCSAKQVGHVHRARCRDIQDRRQGASRKRCADKIVEATGKCHGADIGSQRPVYAAVRCGEPVKRNRRPACRRGGKLIGAGDIGYAQRADLRRAGCGGLPGAGRMLHGEFRRAIGAKRRGRAILVGGCCTGRAIDRDR